MEMEAIDHNEHLNHSRILQFLDKGLKKLHQIFRKRWSIYRVLQCPNEKIYLEDGVGCGKIISELCGSSIDPNSKKNLKLGKIEDWDIPLTKTAIQAVSNALKTFEVLFTKKEDQFVNLLNKIRNEVLHGKFKLTDKEFSSYCTQLTNIFVKAGDKLSDIEAFKKNLMKFGRQKFTENIDKNSQFKNSIATSPQFSQHNQAQRPHNLMSTQFHGKENQKSVHIQAHNNIQMNIPPFVPKLKDYGKFQQYNPIKDDKQGLGVQQFGVTKYKKNIQTNQWEDNEKVKPHESKKDYGIQFKENNSDLPMPKLNPKPKPHSIDKPGEKYNAPEKYEQRYESNQASLPKKEEETILPEVYAVAVIKNRFEQHVNVQQQNQMEKVQEKQNQRNYENKTVQKQPDQFVKELQAIIDQKRNFGNNNNSTSNEGLCAKALFEFDKPEIDEIKFNVNDAITNIECTNKDWWWGKCNGRFGYFPANYVQMI